MCFNLYKIQYVSKVGVNGKFESIHLYSNKSYVCLDDLVCLNVIKVYNPSRCV